MSMKISYWQVAIGALFSLGFIVGLIALFKTAFDNSDAVKILLFSGCGLLLITILPELAEATVGKAGLSFKIRGVEEQLKQHQALINELVTTSVSRYVLEHLAGITLLKEYKYWQNETVGTRFQREFYYLKDRGLIGPDNQEFFAELDNSNIAEMVWPTETGLTYLNLHRDLVPSEWLSINPDKRMNLKVDVAQKLGLKMAEL
jgi:hypothetical protein